MDVNRYYVSPSTKRYRPKKPNEDTEDNVEDGTKTLSARFAKNTLTKVTSKLFKDIDIEVAARLPTPQAFFERQARFRESDRKALLRFAKKKTVKHNLKLRHSELKFLQSDLFNEMKLRLARNITTDEGITSLADLTDTEKTELLQARNLNRIEFEQNLLNEKATGFLLKELEEALDEENEGKINKSVLVSFFEVVDPKRVNEVDTLLANNKGTEYSLFDTVAKEYNVIRSKTHSVSFNYSPTKNLRKSIANVKSTLKRVNSTSSITSFHELPVATSSSSSSHIKTVKSFSSNSNLNLNKTKKKDKDKPVVPVPMRQKSGSFEVIDIALANQVVNKLVERRESQRLKRFDSNLSLVSTLSTSNIPEMENMNTNTKTNEERVEEVHEFREALEKQIKEKKESKEYVTSIVESGGKWWVNRKAPKVHPSQRRRNTFLDELRNGNVPIL